jgi:hypothetical protein
MITSKQDVQSFDSYLEASDILCAFPTEIYRYKLRVWMCIFLQSAADPPGSGEHVIEEKAVVVKADEQWLQVWVSGEEACEACDLANSATATAGS